MITQLLEKIEAIDPSASSFVEWMRGDKTTERPKLPDSVVNEIWENAGWVLEGIQDIVEEALGFSLTKDEERDLNEAVEESWRAERDWHDEQESAEASWRWAVFGR